MACTTRDHELDVAISGYPSSEADMEAITFARNPHCLVAHPRHRLVGREQLQWPDLREHGSATRQFLEHLQVAQRWRRQRKTG